MMTNDCLPKLSPKSTSETTSCYCCCHYDTMMSYYYYCYRCDTTSFHYGMMSHQPMLQCHDM